MGKGVISAASGYIVAVLAVALTVLVRYLLDPVLGWDAPLSIFVLPVVVAAAYRGLYAGLLATALSTIAGAYLFIQPRGIYTDWTAVEQIRVVLYLIEGTAVSVIVEQVHKARLRIQRGDAALRASEAHYRAFFELVSVGTGQVDARTGRFIDVNQTLCDITGYSREELLQLTFPEITHAEDREVDRERYQRLASGEVPAYSTEKRYVRKDGSVIWVHLEVAAVRGLGGEMLRSVAIIEDITGRKRAEEERARLAAAAESERHRLRAVLDVLPVAVFIADAKGNICETNPAAERLWGGAPRYSTVEQYGRDYRGWEPGSGRRLEAHEWGLARALTRGEHCMDEEVEIETFDGKRKAILNYALPIRDDGGHVSGGVAVNVDITGRKRAEEALRESEQRLRATFDNAGVGIAEADIEGRIVVANERFCQIAGRSREELCRMRVLEITHPDDRALTEWYLRELKEGRRNKFAGEKRYVRGDGTAVWVRVAASPVRDQEGRYVRGVVVAEDITEWKRAEEALRASEARLRLAIDSTEMGAFDYDFRTRTLIWSGHSLHHFGLAPGAPAGVEVFRKAVHPEDRERAEGAVRAALRPESGGHYSTEYRTVGIDDGRERWIAARGRVFFDAQGHPERLIGVTLDITEQKRAQAALQESERRERERAAELEAIMDAAPAIIFISRDPECHTILGNRAGYALLRQPPGANLSLSTPDSRRIPNYRPMKDGREIAVAEMPMQRTGRTGQAVRDYEMDFVFDDGSRRTVLGNCVPLLDAEGRPWGVAAVLMDITDRKLAEERLRQSQKLESVGLLAGGIAHDFNNLLVGIVGNASLAQEMLPPGNPAVELLESVVKTGEKAAHLTRQMLAYAGKGRFVIEPVNLSDLAREMSDLVRPSLSKKVALRLDLAPDLPAIEADRGQLQQVVMNLVINAAEAIAEKAGVVTVSTSTVEMGERQVRRNFAGGEVRAGVYARLEVRDTGSGMDEATLSRIFDPFFSTKFTGRGLGLAAVAGIVRGHNGAIHVESAPGKGSCFEVLFPALEGARAEVGPEAHTAAVRGSGTVLVVDDEPVVRQVAVKALERSGFHVLVAESGRAAVDLFKRYPGEIALVLLDLSMPEMSGEETLPELRRIRPGVKVLVSSGYSEAEVMRLFNDGHVYGFIQKPYTSTALAEKVMAALG